MTKLRKDLHLYVIGLRRCAEVRVGKKPPLPHTTSFSKVVPVTRRVYVEHPEWNPRDQWNPYREKTTLKKVEFKQTTWSGGRVLGPISTNALAYIGMYVSRDKVVKVPLKFQESLLRHFNAA